MGQRHQLVFILIGALSGASLAFGHARLKPGSTIEPRSDDSNIKSGPCGNVPRTAMADRTVLTPGQSLMVFWEETIYHPGFFRIAYSMDGGDSFDDNIIVTNIPSDGGPGPTLNDPDSWNQFSTEITVPNVECDDCVIQLIQVMEDRNPPTFYFSCADVRIRTDPDAPLPEPEPEPDPDAETDGDDPDMDAGMSEGEDHSDHDMDDEMTGGSGDAPDAPTGLKLKWTTKGGSQ